jgi:glycosyltransferase involved in cell wall biosynthesis
MTRIALLYYHQLDFGGAERHLLTLLRYGRQAGYEFTLIARMSDRFAVQAKSLGANIIEWQASWHPLNPFTAIQIARILRLRRIQVIHCHDSLAAIPGRLTSWLARIPAVVTVHLPTRVFHGEKQNARARIGRKLYIAIDSSLNWLRTDRLIYVSEQDLKVDVDSRHAPASICQAVHNGIDLSPYQGEFDRDSFRRRLGEPVDVPAVVFTGRLAPQKGIAVLLEAVAQVADSFPNIRVWILGDGPLRLDLEAQVTGNKINGQVRFFGQREDVCDFLRAADIFVLPSFYETMSFSLIEAFAAGLPCVVTPVGDNGWVVETYRAGKVVPAGNAQELAEILSELLGQKSLCQELGANALSAAKAFREEDMVAKIFAVYAEAL